MFLLLLWAGLASVPALAVPPADPDAYAERVMAQPTSFSLAPDEAKAAWERAREFVERFAGAPLCMDSPGLLETARPQGAGISYGYSVSRDSGGEMVRFSVICVPSKSVMVKRANINARILAHYMISGQLIPEYVDQ